MVTFPSLCLFSATKVESFYMTIQPGASSSYTDEHWQGYYEVSVPGALFGPIFFTPLVTISSPVMTPCASSPAL
jgi:hypothetical protein